MDNKEDWSSLDKDVGDVLENIPVDNMEFDSLGELDESKDTFSNKARSLKKDDDKMNNKKKENNNNGYKISKDFFKIIGLIVSGLLLVISLWIMTKCFTPAQEMTNSVLAYNTTNQADYKVHLLKNDFYETDTLGVGEIVPVTFIDKIEIDFSSFLSANKQLNMDYSYHISGVITASSDNGDNEDAGGKIWTKNYEFVEPKSFSESNVTGYAVQEKVIIDYQQYNDLVNRYKLRAAIPMEAALTVTLTVDANSVVENEPLTESTAVSVTIPLSKSTVQIKTSGDGKFNNYLIKGQPLTIEVKRDIMPERDRDIDKKITKCNADIHYGVFLEKDQDVVKIVSKDNDYTP